MSESADDRELMRRFQEQRDDNAFLLVLRRNKDALYRFLLRLSGSPNIAEDLSQQTWLRVLELARSHSYDAASPAQFRTFLFTLARNRYIDDHHRKHEITMTESLSAHDPESIGGAADGADVLELLEAEHARARVRRAMMSLKLEQREVLALWTQGFALKEVARITGDSWETIVSRKKYALQRLALALADNKMSAESA